MAANIKKFYVANISDRCRPWDLATFLGMYGEIVGFFIARKRNTEGLKFGFVSFKGIKDWKEMERNLKDLKLGGFKLKINRARYTKEIEEVEDNRFPPSVNQFDDRQVEKEKVITVKEAHVRNGCSYFPSLMNNSGVPMRRDGFESVDDKTVEVHSETSVFFDLQGRAVVGRAKDIRNLINLKVSLRST
ncbi:putative RNA recognition motif domain, nucleotide-binding alpha-beta plait domain superfamily [Helianthus anomalus]